MISCGEAEEFVPFGCYSLIHHPIHIRFNSSSIAAVNFDDIDENVSYKKGENWHIKPNWIIRLSQDESTEEELYFSDKSVVWSRGIMGVDGSKSVIKTMTHDLAVHQVLFASFYTYPDIPTLMGDHIPDEPTGTEIPSICILDSKYLHVYAESGEDYSIALPFQVRRCWPVKFGILLERLCSISDPDISRVGTHDTFPIFYSLLHPLDEINPILIKKDKLSPNKQIKTKNQQLIIISTHIHPSIAVLYSKSFSCFKICKIRRLNHEESMPLIQNSVLGFSFSATNNSLANTPASHSVPHSPNFPLAGTPSLNPSVRSRLHQTPKSTSFLLHEHLTPVNSRNASPSITRLGNLSPSRSFTASKTARTMLNNSKLNETYSDSEPLIPELCLDVLWSSPCSSPPSNALLSEDNACQKFLCVLFPSVLELKCYKYELNDDDEFKLIGSELTIPAKDASFLSALNILVVVDPSNTLRLYTGIDYICRLHLAGLSSLNSTLFKDFSYLNISSKLNSPACTSMRRSSLIAPSSRPASALDLRFESGLSPVTHDSITDNSFIDDPSLPISSSIVCVRDATDYKLTLEHSSGTMYRVTLPKLWSSVLVGKCIEALKYVLPRDVSLILCNKWYTNRNTPGNSNLSFKVEWSLFAKTLMSLVGYDVEKLSSSGYSDSTSPSILSKKFRAGENGSESDWEYMLSSPYHMVVGSDWSEVLKLQHLDLIQERDDFKREGILDINGPLFSHFPAILYALHLVYEEFKTSIVQWELCSLMVPCLSQMATDLGMVLYLDHYWKDFPNLCSVRGPNAQLSDKDAYQLKFPLYFSKNPPNIYDQVHSIFTKSNCNPFPYIPNVCVNSGNLIILFSIVANNFSSSSFHPENYLSDIDPFNRVYNDIKSRERSLANFNLLNSYCFSDSYSVYEKIVSATNKLNITWEDISIMSPSFSFFLLNAQDVCSMYPPPNWPASAYKLLNRPDLYAQRCFSEQVKLEFSNVSPYSKASGRELYRMKTYNGEKLEVDEKCDENDGMEGLDFSLLKLRWPEDQRVNEVRQMLDSSHPVPINITQRPGISDHDFLEEQARHLYAMGIRTMALSMGRGMFTLSTHSPIITEALPIPPLNLKGRAPQRGTNIEFPVNEVPAEMDMWPLFHNGVAAGLKITPNCGDITSTWIVYNKPKGDASQNLTHAGFLLALGLNGHLKSFATVSLHDYLSQGHELICVGLLLGISIAMRGTMDRRTTKVLSVHLECLLPPTFTELDVPHNVQVAAILGVGLLYANTGHRHMTEVLLREIGRPPGPEMENSNDRESYTLAAGLGLGLIMFGRGMELATSSDFNLSVELYHYMEGGHRKPLTGVMKERYKSPSYQIKEGDLVNINVTSPGATIALGMVYFRSGNKALAEWMMVPNTPFMLDQVRPDFLLFRTIAKGLILWDEVVPSYRWVEGHVPTTILQHVHRGGNQSTPGVDYESIHQAYYNILAGACFVVGLKFAGSANSEAFNVLWKYTRMFTDFTKRSIAELAGKSTIETCLCSILLSLSMVMAGTGDLEVLRLIRFLRSRVGINVSTVGFGSHMAIHMALGFLFLGGGRFSLGTSNIALASLIISCFPKFPTHSNDNRYHLQAFRHLYVLAAEPRLFLPVDVDSGRFCMADVLLRFSDTNCYKDQEYSAKAPHMLPELSKLKEIVVNGNLDEFTYWPVRFTKGTDSWRVLETLLSAGSGVLLKRRHGGTLDSLSPTDHDLNDGSFHFSKRSLNHWFIKGSSLRQMFSHSEELIDSVVNADDSRNSATVISSGGDDTDSLKAGGSGEQEEEDRQLMANVVSILFDCLYFGKAENIFNWVNTFQGIRKIRQMSKYSGLYIRQIKLIESTSSFLRRINRQYYELNQHKSDNKFVNQNDSMETDATTTNNDLASSSGSAFSSILSPEKILSMSDKLSSLADEWAEEVRDEILHYLSGDLSKNFSKKCALTLLLKDIPPSDLIGISKEDLKSSVHVLKKLKKSGLSMKSCVSIAKEVLLFK